MPWDGWKEHPVYPGAGVFSDSSTGETLAHPMDTPNAVALKNEILARNPGGLGPQATGPDALAQNDMFGAPLSRAQATDFLSAGPPAPEARSNAHASVPMPTAAGGSMGGLEARLGVAAVQPMSRQRDMHVDRDVAAPPALPSYAPVQERAVAPPSPAGAAGATGPANASPGDLVATPGGARQGPGGIDSQGAYQRAALLRMQDANGGGAYHVKGGKNQVSETIQGAVPLDPITVSGYFATQAVAQNSALEAQATREAFDGEMGQKRLEADEYYGNREKAVRDEAKVAEDQARSRRDAMFAEVKDAKIDPHEFWASKDETHKAAIVAGLFLSAFGSAISRDGAPSQAMEQLNRMIDQNIDAQKANLAKKQGQLSHLGEVYRQTLDDTKSKVAAEQVARAAGFQQMALQAEAMANTTGSDVYEARVKALHDAADAEVYKARFQYDRSIAGNRGQAFAVTQDHWAGGKTLAQRAKAAEEAGEDLGKADKAAGGNNGIAMNGNFIPTRKDVTDEQRGATQKIVTLADGGLQSLQRAKKRAGELGGYIPGDPALASAATGIAGVYSNLTGSGSPTAQQSALIESAFTPGPRQEPAMRQIEADMKGYQSTAVANVAANGAEPRTTIPDVAASTASAHPSEANGKSRGHVSTSVHYTPPKPLPSSSYLRPEYGGKKGR